MLKELAQKHRDFSSSMPIIVGIELCRWRETYFFKSPKSRSSQRFPFSPGIAADRLNGFEWKGYFSVSIGVHRYYQGGRWGAWGGPYGDYADVRTLL